VPERAYTQAHQKLEQAWRRVTRKGLMLRRTFQRIGVEADNINPGNIVWVFGAGRTGSTWLSAMMEEIEGHTVWFEPRVGEIFNPERFARYGGKHFILGAAYKKTWLGSIRAFVLDGANARFPEVTGSGYLVIKEPGGSVGAPLLMEALPESRMILLVRDPRDVVASWLDAVKKGGWQSEQRNEDGRKRDSLADRNPNAFVRRNAETYLRNVGNAKRAYDEHQGHKVLVRYEDLRADTSGTMRRIYARLGIAVDERELARAVEKHSWEEIPEEQKGEGKFYRKATPGGWREDLTPRQAQTVEQITAPLLKAFYPG
jgi:Sulfotransferase family